MGRLFYKIIKYSYSNYKTYSVLIETINLI